MFWKQEHLQKNGYQEVRHNLLQMEPPEQHTDRLYSLKLLLNDERLPRVNGVASFYGVIKKTIS